MLSKMGKNSRTFVRTSVLYSLYYTSIKGVSCSILKWRGINNIIISCIVLNINFSMCKFSPEMLTEWCSETNWEEILSSQRQIPEDFLDLLQYCMSWVLKPAVLCPDLTLLSTFSFINIWFLIYKATVSATEFFFCQLILRQRRNNKS